jgi:hypothetical protein
MTESCQWKPIYSLLKKYIAEHPEIIIAESEISIPQSVRDEFYQHFDNVRRAVVEDHFSILPVDVLSLSARYLQIEREVLELLNLERICTPVDLDTFLRDPKEGLIRVLYNKTFDLLQGKISEASFESQAMEDLSAATADLFRLGYERWAALELIKLLNPDEAFFVDLDEDYKPILGELKEISFGRQAHHPTMRIPEFVLHLRANDRYVAVKMALVQEIEGYAVRFKPAVRPKKKTGDTSFSLDSRVLFLSLMKTPLDIPVYADIYECTLTSPDLMVEYINEADLSIPNVLEQVQQHVKDLNPKFGTRLIVVGASRDPDPIGLPDNTHAIAIGFDPSKLQSIVDAFSS